MKKILEALSLTAAGLAFLCPVLSSADQVSATASALRMSAALTGGSLPTNSTAFGTMVTDIEAGNYYGAAMVAEATPYFAQYFVARVAGEMQNPLLTPMPLPGNDSGDGSNDAVAMIIANFIGSSTVGGVPHMKTIYSDNSTYEINLVEPGCSTPPCHAHIYFLNGLLEVNWQTELVRTPNQFDASGTQIDAENVGGFFTASTGASDNSMAQYGGSAGTNLRWAEALWEVSMGLTLPQLVVAVPSPLPSEDVPGFVPASDPNFLVGNGQPACISCHGAGGSSLLHGYSTIADLFNFDNGLIYQPAAPTPNRKSLGSNDATRATVLKCYTTGQYPIVGGVEFTTCNPASSGASPTQAWDLTQWQNAGLLSFMGWQGSATGTGLNALGVGIGSALLTYQNMVTRVVNEVCPNSTISQATQLSIATQAQTYDAEATPTTPPFGYIVASVASDPTCHW